MIPHTVDYFHELSCFFIAFYCRYKVVRYTFWHEHHINRTVTHSEHLSFQYFEDLLKLGATSKSLAWTIWFRNVLEASSSLPLLTLWKSSYPSMASQKYFFIIPIFHHFMNNLQKYIIHTKVVGTSCTNPEARSISVNTIGNIHIITFKIFTFWHLTYSCIQDICSTLMKPPSLEKWPFIKDGQHSLSTTESRTLRPHSIAFIFTYEASIHVSSLLH